MSSPPPPSPESLTLRHIYAALNRGDLDAFLAPFHPDIVRIEPPGFTPGYPGAIYRGVPAVRDHIAQGRGSWAEGACEPEDFITIDLPAAAPNAAHVRRVVVLLHVRVRLKSETTWREGRTADVFTFTDGRVIEYRSFATQPPALEWARHPLAPTDAPPADSAAHAAPLAKPGPRLPPRG